MKKNHVQTELDKINQAIAAQEALRGILPAEQIEATLAQLRQKQAELTAQRASPDSAAPSHQANLQGSGSIAQGDKATALGERAISVGGSVGGSIISGNTFVTGGDAASPVTLPPHLATLRDRLTRTFDKSELQTLCFDLGLAYDDLPGDTRTALAQALVAHCYRVERLPELLARCRALRPRADWNIDPA